MGETVKEDGAEGEVALNSQAKGPDLDGTLERLLNTQEAILRTGENLSGKKTEARECTYVVVKIHG